MSLGRDWYGEGGCPPGWSQPAPGYDCRPNVSGQVVQQQNLSTIAAHYVDDSSTQGNATQSTGAPTQSFYTAQPPMAVAPVQVSGGGGGLDTTTLLIIGAILLVVMMKK